MSTSAIVMMIGMLGLFWGGFITLLLVALRRPAPPEDEEEQAEAVNPATRDEPPR